MNPTSASAASAETCDLCRTILGESHQHLMESATRRLECVCDPCAILFSGDHQKYRRVPRRLQVLPDFRMTDSQWDSLMIPIGIVFLYRSSRLGKVVALYPSPAGPVESQLTLEVWEDIEKENPGLQAMEDDVEGLLVYRVDTTKEHYLL